jgi:hypothetical protein
MSFLRRQRTLRFTTNRLDNIGIAISLLSTNRREDGSGNPFQDRIGASNTGRASGNGRASLQSACKARNITFTRRTN